MYKYMYFAEFYWHHYSALTSAWASLTTSGRLSRGRGSSWRTSMRSWISSGRTDATSATQPSPSSSSATSWCSSLQVRWHLSKIEKYTEVQFWILDKHRARQYFGRTNHRFLEMLERGEFNILGERDVRQALLLLIILSQFVENKLGGLLLVWP